MFRTIACRADGKQTGSENRLHVSGPIKCMSNKIEILKYGCSQARLDGAVPEYQNICRCPESLDGNGMRGTTALAQHTRVRPECQSFPSFSRAHFPM